MRILILTTRFHPHIGGVENVVENLAEIWAKNNKVSVLTSKRSQGILDIDDAEIPYQQYKLKRIWMALPRSIGGVIVFPLRVVLSIICLNKYIKEFRPEVLNIHFLDDISFYAWFAIFLNKNLKVVVNIHGNDLHIFSKKILYKYFIHALLKRSRSIVVNSPFMAGDILAYDSSLKNKIVVTPNGLDIEKFTISAGERPIQEKYIFFVGRFVYKKGIDILVRAFSKIGISNLKMILEGKGESLEEIQKLVSELNISNRIIFTEGKLTEFEKINYMKNSLFGVIPSRLEPFGIVGLEFMAAGVPVIVSKTGGLIDIIKDNETGLFFESENQKDLTEKIKLMYQDEKLRSRISENQKKMILKYSWGNIANQYMNLFEKL